MSFKRISLALGCAFALSTSHAETLAEAPDKPIVADFLALLAGEPGAERERLGRIQAGWEESLVPMALETMRLNRNPHIGIALLKLLRDRTGEDFSYDMNAWHQWMWNRPERRHRHYAAFKSSLYRLIDPRFANYFDDARASTIRLDEVMWGGVRQDGIPPLRGPSMIGADEATYLADDNVVFGIEVNGDRRAYPKRILAWHEMFVDEVGGVPVAGVYCTLCGTVILYHTVHDGVNHRLGTSGFLYRSNKLMYDQDTQSLWNTIWGSPVIGPLVGKGIQLERLSVVTTTWGEWRERHPDTLVLSLRTGHARDYSEGEAYREYFATDELMFPVPTLDRRLSNKSEVLALLFAEHPESPLAISADYLAPRPVYHDRVGDVSFVVLTDRSGANRVYQAGQVRFASWDQSATALDATGALWTVSEAELAASDGRRLLRLPAHRAF